VLIIAIADALGVNPFKSFWSNFERMDGWVTLIHLLMLLTVAISVLTTEKLWRRFWQTSIAVSVFVAVYGFLQIAGALTLGQGSGGGWEARIDATFGNPIYLAVYMLFHIFMAALLWVQMWKERRFGERLPLSLWYGCAIALDTLALLFTGTRGTTLGLIGGAGLALVLYAFTPDASKTIRRATVAVIACLVVLSGILWVARDTTAVKSVGFLSRLASISLTDDTVHARFLNMGIAWHGVLERPILGWGQENYAIVFDKYYDPQMYAQEPWFDRVHNIVFDWLVAGGFLGLLSYLSIFGVALYELWKKASKFSYAEKSILTGLFAGYFLHNLTVFDNVTSYILFVFTLAYIAGRGSGVLWQPKRRPLPKIALPIATALCAALAFGMIWYVNAPALSQNRTLIAAITPQQSVQTNFTLFEQAIGYGSFGTQEAREQLAQGATSVAVSQSIDNATKQQFFTLATNQMMLQEQASPLDARFPLFLGVLEDAFGDTTDAATALEKAHELSPNKQQILFQLGTNDQERGDNAGALQAYKQAYELAPQYQEAQLYYAAALIRTNDDAAAEKILAPLIPTGVAADPRITAAYAQRGEYGKIATIFAAHVKVDPQDVQGYFTLAAAYVGAGQSINAIAALQAAEAISPSATTQAEALIEQVRNGTAKVQ
jgi:O-antigen ligase/tetratricopeptide (TPR) repeat protein